MVKKIFSLFIVALITVTSGCSKKEAEPEKIDYSYFPVTTGSFLVYDVHKKVYDEFNGGAVTEKDYQLMEKISSTFKDNSGRTTQRVEQYTRTDTTSGWILEKVVAVNLTATTAERMEDNERFINLIFPVKKSASWNANSFNTRDEQDYRYTAVDSPEKIGSFSLAQVSTVLQNNDSNLIQKNYAVEKYAKNIGLVYKIFIKDSSTAKNLAVPFKDRITGGTELKMTLHTYGK